MTEHGGMLLMYNRVISIPTLPYSDNVIWGTNMFLRRQFTNNIHLKVDEKLPPNN